MLCADVEHCGCRAKPDNKKAEITLKIHHEKVQTE